VTLPLPIDVQCGALADARTNIPALLLLAVFGESALPLYRSVTLGSLAQFDLAANRRIKSDWFIGVVSGVCLDDDKTPTLKPAWKIVTTRVFHADTCDCADNPDATCTCVSLRSYHRDCGSRRYLTVCVEAGELGAEADGARRRLQSSSSASGSESSASEPEELVGLVFRADLVALLGG
jgi:hypothetical protein